MSNGTVAAVPRTNEQIVARIKAGVDPAAEMLELYKQNRGIIYRFAKKYSGYAEMDDLMQEGYLALCETVEHYDLEQNVLFITYAGYWISQRMQRYIDNCCHSVRFPVQMQINIRKYEKVVKEYWKEYNREPSENELCELLCVSLEKLMDIKKNAKIAKIRSLSEPIGGEDEEITLGENIASDQDMEEDVCRELDHEIMQKALWKEVDELSEQQAAVIRMRYRDGMTLKETGQQLGVSCGMARRIEAKAFRCLRMPDKCEGLKKYYEQYISASPVYHVGVKAFQDTWLSAVEREAYKHLGVEDMFSWNQ